MKLISWNVNGLRTILEKGLEAFLTEEKPDVFCLQEIKCQPDQLPDGKLEGYHLYWNSGERKGYSGVLTACRQKPLDCRLGIGVEDADKEGRVITLEYEDYFLVNVYTPNSKRDLSRLSFRQKVWDIAFLKYLQQLQQKKPIITCGDLNVAHKEIDLKNPKINRRNAGFTAEEREGIENYIQAGFIDTFREFEQGEGHYTWWSYRSAARKRNVGWRIDYCLISPSLRPQLQEAFIRSEIMGSDHCPVGIKLN